LACALTEPTDTYGGVGLPMADVRRLHAVVVGVVVL